MKLGAPLTCPGLRAVCTTMQGMGVKEELLETRAASAMTLRDFDNDLRRLRVVILSGRLKRERKLLSDMLTDLGGEPWPYAPDDDNSWVP